MTTRLPAPPTDPEGVVAWVDAHLGALTLEGPGGTARSGRFSGTQAAADAALAAYDVTGYARARNEVWPVRRRGASALSPWIRHGHLPLPVVWDHVADGPGRDRKKYRDELLWQEWSRHLYARLGGRTSRPLRAVPPADGPGGWDVSMRCMEAVVDELETDGWLVNQTRMWLASQWTVRHRGDWREGEDEFFRHLLDGSRAANRAGWQWTTGAGSAKPYDFSRWQVNKRAPAWCEECDLRWSCPIEQRPDPIELHDVGPVAALRRDDDPGSTGGPVDVESTGVPEVVWLTAESLGDRDPALAARSELPVVFTFDADLLDRLRLSSKRLCFLADRLGELADERDVEVHLGDPVTALGGRATAVTFAPVPGFRSRSRRADVAELHPWPWLRRPHGGPVRSYTAWVLASGGDPRQG